MTIRSVTIDQLLAEHGPPDSWHSRAGAHPCEGAKFHSPSPLLTKQHDELGVWLCPTCESNLACFVHLAGAQTLDWPIAREFGNTIRAMGQKIIAKEAS